MPIVVLVVLGVVGWLVLTAVVGLLIARIVAQRELQRPSVPPSAITARPAPPSAPVGTTPSPPGYDPTASPTPDPPPETGRVVLIDAGRHPRLAVDMLAALVSTPIVDVVMVITGGPATGPDHRVLGSVSASNDIAGATQTAGIPLMTIGEINAARVLAPVRATAPDLLVVAGRQQLAGDLLAVPRRGCVGLELCVPGATRSAAAASWTILRGDAHLDTTMQMLGPDPDDDDIVERVGVLIEPDDTCATLEDRCAAAGADLLRRQLPALLTGTAPRQPHRFSGGPVLPARTPEMGVTDWTRPAAALHDWVRALTWPCSGAYTTFGDRTVMLWNARLPTTPGPTGRPGEILSFDPDGVRIAAGAGSLVVTEMSDRGRPARPAVQWCRDNRLQPGTRFDQVSAAIAQWALGLAAHPDEGPR